MKLNEVDKLKFEFCTLLHSICIMYIYKFNFDPSLFDVMKIQAETMFE